MFRFPNVWVVFACFLLFQVDSAYSKEYSLKADVDARTEWNDNIFLTNQPHDAAKGITITPSLAGIVKEESWEAKLRARLRSYNYTDKNLNGNDQLFDLTGRYTLERNIFALNVNHNLDSNLNATSSDFGIVARRIERKMQSITPQYTRLMTERLFLTLSYSYTDTDYLDAGKTGFVPYVTQSGSGSLIYALSDRNKLTISLNAVDYVSRNKLITYQLFTSRIGMDHKFSETLSTDFLIGVSRRNSTNRQTRSFDFFGNPITITQEIDSRNRGVVLDAGITRLLENGKVEGRVSRNDGTDSFGGLNVTNRFKINYSDKISELWRYKINGSFDDISSISSGSRRTDRKLFLFESVASYSISTNWNMNASYRYIVRRFKSDLRDSKAPSSNRIYVGLTYNFPSLSTF